MAMPALVRRRAYDTRRFDELDFVSVALAVLFTVLLAYPLIEMLRRVLFPGGRFAAEAFEATVTHPAFGTTILHTTLVVLGSGALAVAIATLFAWLNERTDAGMGLVSLMLPLVPLLLPPIALSSGWFFLAHDRAGSVNVVLRTIGEWLGLSGPAAQGSGPFDIATWQGLVFVYTLYLVPFAYLVVGAAFRNMDYSLEEASRASGAGHWRTFGRISVPAIAPALVSACLLVSIVGLSSFSIPVTIGTAARMEIVSVRIVRLIRDAYPPRIDEAVVLGLFVLVVVGTLWFLQRRVAARQRHATIGGKVTSASRIRLGALKWPARFLMLGYLVATSILPLLALIFVSLQRFWSPRIDLSQLSLATFRDLFSGTGMMRRALVNSVSLGVIGATLTIVLAALLMMYVQQRKGPFARFTDGATKAPGAVSHIVVGLGFVVALTGPPFNLAGTMLILLLAYLVIYMPQAAVAVGSGLGQISSELTEASSVAGASRARTFGRVTLPLLRPALAAGWALLFVVMVGDLTASSLLATGSNPVVGFVIYDIWGSATYSYLAAVATVVGLVSFVAVGVVMAFGRSGHVNAPTS
jgi:iron(III) transport system permease protein